MSGRIVFVVAGLLAVDPVGWSQRACEHAAHAAEPVRQSIVISNGKVDGGQNVIRVVQGDTVELEFTGDEAAELHLHGYDRLVTLQPGRPAVLRVEATIAGRFPLEAHAFGTGGGRRHMHSVVLYLEVLPR
jgi:hypothetical protein